MGQIVSSVAEPIVEKQKMAKVMEMRQGKMQRDMQMAIQIAMTKDRVYWMLGFAGAMGTVGLVRKTMKASPVMPLPLIPGLIFTTVVLYQADMVWGNKMNRIKDEADLIRSDSRFWFNQPMKLPPSMKPVYRKAMDELNRDLAKNDEEQVKKEVNGEEEEEDEEGDQNYLQLVEGRSISDMMDPTERSLHALKLVAGEERRLNIKSTFVAEWNADVGMGMVKQPRGQSLKNMGIANRHGIQLFPEEILFLLDRGSAVVKSSSKSSLVGETLADVNPSYAASFVANAMSFQEACNLILGTHKCSSDVYQVYAYLKRIGYVLYRTNAEEQLLSLTAPRNATYRQRIGTSFLGFGHRVQLPSPFSIMKTLFSWIIRQIGRGFAFVFSLFGYKCKGKPSALIPFFDVYKPKPNFRKTARGQPDFRILIASSQESIPDIDEMVSLMKSTTDSIQIKIAVVDAAQIKFLDVTPALMSLDDVPRRHHKTKKRKPRKKRVRPAAPPEPSASPVTT
ncbi:tRNA-splicing endonuclease subunit sen54 [Phlyctochytrium planicorne]|nr:tRNA-splicing endonuclease subunit sen54 [Phlyctochytrium planicorne]